MASAPAVPVSSATLPLAIEALVRRFGALTAVAGQQSARHQMYILAHPAKFPAKE